MIKISYDHFNNGHKYFFDKIKKTPALYSYLINSEFIPTSEYFNSINLNYGLPDIRFENEEHEAVLKFHLIEYLVVQPQTTISGWLSAFVGNLDYVDSINTYVEGFIDPIVHFLNDQLDEGSSILYLIERYKLRTEWFYNQRLIELYRNNSTTGETKLEEDLRLFLFDQGIDYPFSTPLSASGRADVVSMLHTDDPLVIEIKIYDESKNYRKNRIVEGFSQIVKYANDYHKNIGYLIIFVIDPIVIEVQGAEKENTWPNRILFEGKSYYIIFINLNKTTTASKTGIVKKQLITLNDLTSFS